MSKNQITEKDLFTPVGNRRLTDTYKELRDVPELKELTSAQIKFCWYMGCYFADVDDLKEKTTRSLEMSDLHNMIDDKDIDLWVNGRLPSEIQNGVRKFESMDVVPRFHSRMIAETALKNYQILLATDINEVGKVVIYDEETGEAQGEKRDWQQVSAYVNTTQKVLESLPKLLSTIEHSFGIREKKTLDTSSMREQYQEKVSKRNK